MLEEEDYEEQEAEINEDEEDEDDEITAVPLTEAETDLPDPVPQSAPILKLVPPSTVSAPIIKLQQSSPSQVTSLINTGKPLAPLKPLQTSVVATKPVVITPTQSVPVAASVPQTVLPPGRTGIAEGNISSERIQINQMRDAYARKAREIYRNTITQETAMLLAEMAVNKAIYGLRYPEESDKVIRYINSEMLK